MFRKLPSSNDCNIWEQVWRASSLAVPQKPWAIVQKLNESHLNNPKRLWRKAATESPPSMRIALSGAKSLSKALAMPYCWQDSIGVGFACIFNYTNPWLFFAEASWMICIYFLKINYALPAFKNIKHIQSMRSYIVQGNLKEYWTTERLRRKSHISPCLRVWAPKEKQSVHSRQILRLSQYFWRYVLLRDLLSASKELSANAAVLQEPFCFLYKTFNNFIIACPLTPSANPLD